MALRLLLPARKSRKGDDFDASTAYTRQESRAKERAEREGHTIVDTVRDLVSSQSMPWDRKELKKWMTDPAKLALFDGIIVEADRLSRADDKGWHRIESFCYDHDKVILTTEGVQFPPRDDSDRYQWLGLKRRARTYWEDVRDKHAQTREVIRARQEATGGREGIIGMPPFGYRIEGAKLHKTFVPDEVTAPLAVEAFERIARGASAASVARWLTEQCEPLGLLRIDKKTKKPIPWRIKRVQDMIKRRTYLGERDGARFEALVSEELFNAANVALSARSFTHKETGGKTVHAFSGLLYCTCGSVMYQHKSERGKAKYVCARGRVGDVTVQKCGSPALDFDAVNDAVHAFMLQDPMPEYVMSVTGGDAGKKLALADLEAQIAKANRDGDMDLLVTLASKRKEVEATPEEPIEVKWIKTGRRIADVWKAGSLEERRALLKSRTPHLFLTVEGEGVNVTVRMDGEMA